MPRPRKPRIVTREPVKRWGILTPKVREMERKDGTAHAFFYVQYPVTIWVDDPVIGWSRKKIYRAVRGASSKECSRNAEAKMAEAQRYVTWMEANGEPRITFENWKSGDSPYDIEADACTTRPRTLAEANDEYLASRVRFQPHRGEADLRTSTVERSRKYIAATKAIKDQPLSKLDVRAVLQWFKKYASTHSQNTVSRTRAHLVAVGDFAVTVGSWQANHFRSLPKVSATKQDDKPIFSFEQIDQVWNAAEQANLKALLVLLRMGLRIGEALGLTSDDILDKHRIRIHYTATEKENDGTLHPKHKIVPYQGHTKTRASHSKVVIPPQWMDILKASLANAKPMRIAAFDDGEAGPREHLFVINNKFGTRWGHENARRAMQELLKRAGVEIDRSTGNLGHEPIFHIWRYTYCSDLTALGASDIEQMRLMRHTNPNLSKEVYAQIRMEDKSKFQPYIRMIKNVNDYNRIVGLMDEDRRNKSGSFAAKQTATTAVAAALHQAKPILKSGPMISGNVHGDGTVTANVSIGEQCLRT